MASIRSRGDSYQARVIRKGFPPLARSFSTRREAEIWAAQMEADIGRGRFIDARESERTTLRECLARYQREISPLKKGHQKEVSVINRWLRSPLADRTMASIRGMDLAAYRDARLQQVSAHTVSNELILLSHLFTIARKEWGMESLVNPVTLIRRPRRPPARTRRLLPGEEERLLGAASPTLCRAIILAVETGMRQSEIAGLRAPDIDLATRVVRLHDTKNGESRLVPLSSRAVDALRDGPVGLTAGSLSHAFADLCKAVGITGLHFHDLRREAASRLFERGLSLTEVASITGHKTWAMLRVYTALKPEALIAKLD